MRTRWAAAAGAWALIVLSGGPSRCLAGGSEGVTVTVKADRPGPEINPYLYGQFIEHLGRCIYGGIWAEMLEDRKFYFPVSDTYRPYRSLEKSAYPVVGASPWEVMGPAGSVTMDGDAPFVGKHTPRIAPGSGIRQRDLGVVADKSYVGYVWLKSPEGEATVEATLVWGEGADARETIRLEGIRAEYKKFELSYRPRGSSEKASLELAVGGAPVLVGTVSLMPSDNVRGMRADTLALLKQLGGTMYRWPGGNFVSGYDWREGIGDRDKRPPRRNPAWTGVEHNDFGIDEFIDFCREIDTEPVIAVNTGLGDAYSAAQEVEYCNGDASTIGGSWRAANGHAEPYKVRYWCVGNEMFGPWQLGFMQLKHYTFKHNLVADAMRRVDPDLQLIGSGDLGMMHRRNDPDERRSWSRGMLEECAERMNLISEHFYHDRGKDLAEHVQLLARSIREKAEGHRKLQAELGLIPSRPIPIAMDEWNYWHKDYVYGELGCEYDLADALGVAIGLHEYFRNTDIIQMAHYAQTVNVIGCIKTTKTSAYLDTTALPLMLYRHRFGRIPVEVSVGGADSGLDVSAAWTEDRKALTVGVVNPSREARKLDLRIEGVEPQEEGRAWVIAGDDPATVNVPGEERLKIEERRVKVAQPMELAPLSITVVHIPVH